MHRLVALALQFRFVVVLATVLVVALGVSSLQRLPIEGVPDITPNQVLVLTRAPSLSPPEVEKYITFPIEWSMSGLPGITNIYSLSKLGTSYVAVYFREDMDIYFCRRLVMERLAQAKALVPPDMGTPEMGPITTGMGEIYQFKVAGEGISNMELRSILDWDIAPKLRSVPGIVEVNTHGGELKTYEVQVDSDRMTAYRIPLSTIIRALGESNGNAGGAYLEHPGQQSLIRGEGLISSLQDVEQIVVGVGRIALFGVVPLLTLLLLGERPSEYGLRLGAWRIGRRLFDLQASHHVDKHVLVAQAQSKAPSQHGRDQQQAVEVDTVGRPPGIAEGRWARQALDLDQ